MSKESDGLAERIARLGTGLATRSRSVESDLVVGRVSTKTLRAKNLAVRLSAPDLALLDEFGIWSRQHGLQAGWGTLLKAGLRMLRKDESSLQTLRHVLQSDGRRKGHP